MKFVTLLTIRINRNKKKPTLMTATFLVDDVLPERTIGITYTKEKYDYNLNLLSEYMPKELPLTFFFPAGRYIMIARATQDRTEYKMFFIDYRANIEIIRNEFPEFISESVAKGFKNLSMQIKEEFSDDLDNVVLSASIYPGPMI